jgi:branched-chain amino acid transport system permease protein
MVWLQLLISGILVGGIYGLISMGFVTVYRNARVFNIAYGEFAVLGAFLAWTFLGSPSHPRLPLAVGLPLTLLAAVAFGLLVERILFRPMIGKSLLSSFMISLGLLAALYSAVLIFWGPQTLALRPIFPTGTVKLGEIVIQQEYIWSFLVAAVLAAGLTLFFRRTRLGLAMRAAYDNQVVARSLGVSISGSSQIAWSLCSIIATIGGILIATVSGISMFLSELVMVVLVVVLLAGMDSLAGCIVGGLIIAGGQTFAGYYLEQYLPGIQGIFSFVLIVVVLLFRPNGLFGVKPIERV